MQHMKARLVYKKKEWRSDGVIIEAVVWALPAATKERPHGYKYRLFCGRPGECLVRYDNESGKGDHRHYGTREEPYRFVSLSRLIDDFLSDVKRLTGD